MVHRVVDGVPGGAETALLAVWIIGDDVDAGNLGDFVHRDMIVGDGNTLLLGEATAIAYDLPRTGKDIIFNQWDKNGKKTQKTLKWNGHGFSF